MHKSERKRRRCTYTGCSRHRMPNGKFCKQCAAPDNRPHCECGAEIGLKAKRCVECARLAKKKTSSKWGSQDPMPPTEIMKLYRTGAEDWERMKPEQRIAQSWLARDLVALGLLTKRQSRATFPDAWKRDPQEDATDD